MALFHPFPLVLLVVDLRKQSGCVVVQRRTLWRWQLARFLHTFLQLSFKLFARTGAFTVRCPAVQHLRHDHQTWVGLLFGHLCSHTQSWQPWKPSFRKVSHGEDFFPQRI